VRVSFRFTVRRTWYTPTAAAAAVHGRRSRCGRGGRGRQRRGAARRGARRWSPRRPGTFRHRRHVRPTPTATASRPPGPPKHGCRGSGSGRSRRCTAPPSPSTAASRAPPTAAAATAAATTTPRIGYVPFGGRGRCGGHAAKPCVAGRGWRYAGKQSHVWRPVRRRARSSET